MTAAKKKRLTQREKAMNAKFKKELQTKGVLPPDKPRLNRKKFAKEVMSEYCEARVAFLKGFSIALSCMVGSNMKTVDAEQVGVLKLIKLSIETGKFLEALDAEGRKDYDIEEYLKTIVFPILEL